MENIIPVFMVDLSPIGNQLLKFRNCKFHSQLQMKIKGLKRSQKVFGSGHKGENFLPVVPGAVWTNWKHPLHWDPKIQGEEE